MLHYLLLGAAVHAGVALAGDKVDSELKLVKPDDDVDVIVQYRDEAARACFKSLDTVMPPLSMTAQPTRLPV